MLNTLKQIFNKYEFIQENKNSDIFDLYSLKDEDYFIVSEFLIDELVSFFDCVKTNDIVDSFLKMSDEKLDVSKNTSMIILVKVENLRDFYEEYRNRVMLIEEDEFYFRKYVIVYTETGFIKLYKNIDDIFGLLFKEELIDEFEKDMYFSDEYFIGIQLVIKLPFIILPKSEDKFISIQEKLNINLEENDLSSIESQVDSFFKLIEQAPDTFFEELEKELFNMNDTGDLIQQINNILEGRTL